MSNVFVCGAETLSVPTAVSLADLDANASRYVSLRDWLRYELRALYTAGYMTSLACASDSALLPLFTGNAGGGDNVVPVAPNAPSQIHPVLTTATAAAISSFGANMIVNMNGGAAPDPSLVTAIAALQAQATAGGVLWRDAREVRTPTLKLSQGAMVKSVPANAVSRFHGTIEGYLLPPTLQVSLNGAAFEALPNGTTTLNDFSFSISTIGLTTLVVIVRDTATPTVICTATFVYT